MDKGMDMICWEVGLGWTDTLPVHLWWYWESVHHTKPTIWKGAGLCVPRLYGM